MKFEDLAIDTNTEKPYTRNRQKDMNLSSIFTELIKQAAVCEAYSSDICYEIHEIMSAMDGKIDPACIFKTYMFGFREFGVDHDNFIKCRLEGSPNCDPRKIYRRIYLLRFEPDPECDGFVKVWFKRAM